MAPQQPNFSQSSATFSQLYDTLQGMGGYQPKRGQDDMFKPQVSPMPPQPQTFPQQNQYDDGRPQVRLRAPVYDEAQEMETMRRAQQRMPVDPFMQQMRDAQRTSQQLTPMPPQPQVSQREPGYESEEAIRRMEPYKMYADGGAIGQAPTTQQVRQEDPRMQAMRNMQRRGGPNR